ncbi:MAG: hypothetical protein ABI275_04860 [Terrimesophilobacter sp.]
MAPTELLTKRPPNGIIRRSVSQSQHTTASASRAPSYRPEHLVAIHSAGTDFLVRERMASIFLRRALDLVADGGSGLVPLLHSAGLDLLLITPATAVACFYDGQPLAILRRRYNAPARLTVRAETPTR